VAFHQRSDGAEPVRSDSVAGAREERRTVRSLLATGTLACPSCDAPVAPGGTPLRPAHPLRCPYCLHAGAVRDFLSLGEPTRPARVSVRVVTAAGASAGRPRAASGSGSATRWYRRRA
jgi:hypothetical protein